jgi:hypothetical protein
MEELAEETDEPLLFLPFPFTTNEVKQPPYKGSDPEWLAFLAVNKDQQAQKDIKCTKYTKKPDSIHFLQAHELNFHDSRIGRNDKTWGRKEPRLCQVVRRERY